MKYRVFGDTIAVRLNRGEEVMAQLKTVCEAEKITAGTLTGIGAADYAVVGLYEVEKRSYHSNTLKEEMEITNLTGNISQKDGSLYLHLHATLADESGKAFGGHLNEARISGAGEIFIHRLDGGINRIPDDDTGLNIMDW